MRAIIARTHRRGCVLIPDGWSANRKLTHYSFGKQLKLSRWLQTSQTNAHNLGNFSRRKTRASLDMYMCNQ
jgi:hypothetical protein